MADFTWFQVWDPSLLISFLSHGLEVTLDGQTFDVLLTLDKRRSEIWDWTGIQQGLRGSEVELEVNKDFTSYSPLSSFVLLL